MIWVPSHPAGHSATELTTGRTLTVAFYCPDDDEFADERRPPTMGVVRLWLPGETEGEAVFRGTVAEVEHWWSAFWLRTGMITDDPDINYGVRPATRNR